MRYCSYLILAAIAASNICAFGVAITTTTLTVTSGGASITSVPLGAAVTLTAAVASTGASISSGTVNFCDAAISTSCSGLAVIGTAQLTSSGTASIIVRLGVGSHSLRAIFAGTSAYSGSSSSTSALAVTGKYASVTTISSSAGTPLAYMA